jgi:hypothetical protein
MDPEYENVSDRKLAELANVSSPTIASVRKELNLVPEVTVGKDGKEYTFRKKGSSERVRELPVPQGVTESEWDHTPKSVKKLLWLYMK